MLKKLIAYALVIIFLTAPTAVLNAQDDGGRAEGINAEVHYLSQQALSKVADSLVSKVLEMSPGMRSLIICGSEECRDLIQARLAFEVFEAESEDLITEYASLDMPVSELVAKLEKIPDPEIRSSDGEPVIRAYSSISESVSGLTQTIGSIEGLVNQSGSALVGIFSLINLLRNTNVRIDSSSLPVDDSLLTTAIAARLKSESSTSAIKVYLPAYAQMANIAVADSKVFKKYRGLLALLRKAEASDVLISVHRNLQVGRSDAKTIEQLRTLNQKTAAFLTSLSYVPALQTDDENAPTVPASPNFQILEGLIIGEKFSRMLSEGGMILRVGVINLIGTQITKTNLITGKRIRFSGSATVQYVLTDNSGDLIYANTDIFHTGFKKMSDLRDQ